MASKRIGIDFGTSNSTCSVLHEGKAQLIPLEGESLTMPSALFFKEDGDILFGRESVTAYLEGEEGRFMRSLKSILGTSLMDERTRVNKKYVTFKDIIAIYIRQLKIRTEAYLGHEVTDLVLGRPVHFHDDNPDADNISEDTLREIAGNIGFREVKFQYEPIAAAFSHERILQEDQLALVVDLGGGTSDFTVIRLSPQRARQADRSNDVLANTGIRVGGTNFDQRLSMKCVMPSLGMGSQFKDSMDSRKILDMPLKTYHKLSTWAEVHMAQTEQAIRETKSILRTALEPEKLEQLLFLQESGLGHAVLKGVEDAKIALSDTMETRVDLSDIDLDVRVDIRRAEFEDVIKSETDRIADAMDDCLRQAGTTGDQIGLMILTGGSSELPVIDQLVKQKFPKARMSNDDKFGSVGRGLAYSAL